MVIAQAKSVEAEGDSVVFTFAPVHKGLRAQLEGRRSWLEQLAHATSGRKIAIVAREGVSAAGPQAEPVDPAAGAQSRRCARAPKPIRVCRPCSTSSAAKSRTWKR